MFGIGFFELVVIAVVALIFIGPQRLPEFMKQAGRIFVQVRRTANDVRSTFDHVIRDAEAEIRREEVEAMRAKIAATSPTPTAHVPAAHPQDVHLIEPGQPNYHDPSGTDLTPPGAVALGSGPAPDHTNEGPESPQSPQSSDSTQSTASDRA